VRHADKDLAGFRVTLRYESLVGLGEALVSGLVSLRYFPDFLIHYQQVVVLIYDPAREVVVFFFCQLSVNHGAKLHKKAVPWSTGRLSF